MWISDGTYIKKIGMVYLSPVNCGKFCRDFQDMNQKCKMKSKNKNHT